MSKEIDHNRTDEITCPWCGYEDEDSWEFEGEENSNPSSIGLIQCGSCDKCFSAEREMEVYYSTQKAVYGKCECCQEENKVLVRGCVGHDKNKNELLYQMLCEECGWFQIY